MDYKKGQKSRKRLLSVPVVMMTVLILLIVIPADAKKPVAREKPDPGVLAPDNLEVLKPALIVDPMCYNNTIQIDPPNPTGADHIIISPSGLWCDMCIPEYDAHHISGHTIRIFAIANEKDKVCADVALPWEFVVDMGALPPGEYTVEVYISKAKGLPVLNDTTVFTVLEPAMFNTETSSSEPSIFPVPEHFKPGIKSVAIKPMCYDNCLYVNPPKPTVGDNVGFIVSGTWCDSCVPKYKSHDIVGRTIRIYAKTAKPSAACVPDRTGWSFNVDVGTLKASDYRVEFYISIFGNPYVINDTSTFTVREPGLM